MVLLPVVAAGCFVLVGVTAWVGGRWSIGPWSVRNPTPRLVVGTIALALWYLTYLKRPGAALPWKAITARFTLLALSLLAVWTLSEWAFRRRLEASRGFGTFEMLRAQEAGAVITPRSRHPVAELITLSSNHRLIYELRSDLDRRFGDYRVRTNGDGLREVLTYARPKPPGVRRVLGIGDSGMFGWDVAQDENYLARLERAYADRAGPGTIEVLNAGAPGYNTQQEVEWLAAKGLDFEPDVVVVGWCNNDYDAPFFLYESPDFTDLPGSLLYRYLFEREGFFADTKPRISIYTDFERSGIHPEVLGGMGEKGVRASFSRLLELSESHGFKVLVFGPVDETARAICRDLGLPYLNTYEAIPRGSVPSRYRVHRMHPTADGHAVLAAHLERELDRLGWTL